MLVSNKQKWEFVFWMRKEACKMSDFIREENDMIFSGNNIDFIKTVKGSGIWNCGAGLAHSFLDIAEEIAEQEGVEIEFVPVPATEQLRMRHATKANLKHLKETIGKRKWLNVFEFLDQ